MERSNAEKLIRHARDAAAALDEASAVTMELDAEEAKAIRRLIAPCFGAVNSIFDAVGRDFPDLHPFANEPWFKG